MVSTVSCRALKHSFFPSLRVWWLALLLWAIAVAPASASVLLRVAIKNGVGQVEVGSNQAATVRDGAGRTLGQLPPMTAFAAQPRDGGVAISQWLSGGIWVEPSNGGYIYIGDRWYRGKVLLAPGSGGLVAVNYVDLEDYLYSVVGAEMYPSWPAEALKTQAVAARSYALYRRDRQATPLYDVGNTTTWQVYEGLSAETNTTHAAVDATAGQVLTDNNGNIIEAVYHANSGGHTENVEDIWQGEARAYLRGVPDYDQNAPTFQWSKAFSQAQMSNMVPGVGNVVSMTPERATPHGRIITMRVTGTEGSTLVSGSSLQRAMDLKSTRFQVVSPDGGTTFQVIGGGFGHGIGMSQWGALGLARAGYNYQQILAHYYRNTTLARIQPR